MSSDKNEAGVELPDGITHLHGAMYLVRFNLLQVPDPDAKCGDEANKEYEFRNPRTLTEKGQSVLFDKQKSQEMRDSIREKTLLTPFICRWKNKAVQMVGGERRHRAVSWLIHKKEMVKDPRSLKFNDDMEPQYDYSPADQVYEFVLCQIYHASNDLDALALAYTENDCRVNQGPGHDIAMVLELRKCGASDEKIMGVMSKDEKWLRDTDNLIAGLDESTLRDVIEDTIDREAALELLPIKEKFNEEVTAKVKEVAKDLADKDYKKRFERLTKRLTEARDEQEIAEGNVADSSFRSDAQQAEDQESLTEATAKVQRIAKDRAGDKPKVTPGNVRSGLRVIVGEGESEDGEGTAAPSGGARPPTQPKALRYAKIKEAYIDVLDDLVKKGGKHPEFKEFTASPDACKLAKKLISALATGDSECIEIIRLHYKGLSG
jgi:hypothetical protein